MFAQDQISCYFIRATHPGYIGIFVGDEESLAPILFLHINLLKCLEKFLSCQALPSGSVSQL